MNNENTATTPEQVMIDRTMIDDPRYAHLFDGILGDLLREIPPVHTVNTPSWKDTAKNAAIIIAVVAFVTMLIIAEVAAR